MNKEVINLLEELQEYVSTMSHLQESMMDGFYEISRARKSYFGINPEFVSGVGENTRKIYQKDSEINSPCDKIGLPGVSADIVQSIKSHFENSLLLVLNSAKIIAQIQEQCKKIQK